MEELTARQEAVLDIIDAQIALLEKKLAKAKPFMDELEKLRATRRVLLSERGVTATGAARHRLSMESVIHYLQEHGASSPMDIAEALGVPDSTVRSHLNRGKDVRYTQDNGMWDLIEGEDKE